MALLLLLMMMLLILVHYSSDNDDESDSNPVAGWTESSLQAIPPNKIRQYSAKS